jgi:hypothetical protein
MMRRSLRTSSALATYSIVVPLARKTVLRSAILPATASASARFSRTWATSRLSSAALIALDACAAPPWKRDRKPSPLSRLMSRRIVCVDTPSSDASSSMRVDRRSGRSAA